MCELASLRPPRSKQEKHNSIRGLRIMKINNEMPRQARLWIGGLWLALAGLLLAGNVLAQNRQDLPPPDPARQARMEQLFNAIDLPLTKQVFDQFLASLRESMINDLLTGMGTGAKLGSEWKGGNPHFEQARAVVRRSLDAGEKVEPLFNIGPRALASELRVDWTDDDIEFMLRTMQTPLGAKMLEWMDAFMAPMLVREFARSPKYAGFVNDKVRDLTRTADQRLLTLTPELAQVAKGNEAALSRIEVLAKAFNGDAGRVVGLRIGGRSLARLMILMRDFMPELTPIFQEYRRQQGGAGQT
jgi:hypothetical protein